MLRKPFNEKRIFLTEEDQLICDEIYGHLALVRDSVKSDIDSNCYAKYALMYDKLLILQIDEELTNFNFSRTLSKITTMLTSLRAILCLTGNFVTILKPHLNLFTRRRILFSAGRLFRT